MTNPNPNAPPSPPSTDTEKKPEKGIVPEGKTVYVGGKKLKAGAKISPAIQKQLDKKPPKKKP